ncbi:MAG: hypothetical protein P8182_20480 [Deltaproteobacteria bacterium]
MHWSKLVKVVLLVTAVAVLVVPGIAGAGSCPLCNIFGGGSSSYSSSPGYGYGYSGGYGYGYGQAPYWSQYQYMQPPKTWSTTVRTPLLSGV